MLRTSVHGHEVIRLLAQLESPPARDEFLALMSERFGEESHYHNCVHENLSAGQLIDFLLARGKFLLEKDRLKPGFNRHCQERHPGL